MKKRKLATVLMGLWFMAACSGTENEVIEMEEPVIVQEEAAEVEEVEEASAALESVLQVVRGGGNHNLSLVDLSTGTEVTAFEFSEEELIWQLWELADGYLAVWVEAEDPMFRAFRLGVDLEDLDEAEEHASRFVIFDEALNVVETLEFNEETALSQNGRFLRVSGKALRFEGGELYLYGEVTPENFEEVSGEVVRHQVRSGETEIIARHDFDFSLNVLGFVNDRQLAVQATSGPQENVRIHAGVLDLETGEISLIERELDSLKDFIFTGSHLLLTESISNDPSLFGFTDEIIVLDLQTLEEAVIAVQPQDSIWARLSDSGNEIVTVNTGEGVVRKYSFDGDVLGEVPLLENLPDVISRFDIFPLSENDYAIYTIQEGNMQLQVVSFD